MAISNARPLPVRANGSFGSSRCCHTAHARGARGRACSPSSAKLIPACAWLPSSPSSFPSRAAGSTPCFPGSDIGAQDAFRLFVGDRLAFEWRFDVVSSWQIDAAVALESGRTSRGRAWSTSPRVQRAHAEAAPPACEPSPALIESCDRSDTLQSWILQCPTLSGSRFAALAEAQRIDRGLDMPSSLVTLEPAQ
jgi:hypothetical protein